VVAKLGNKRVKGYADLVDALRSHKPGTTVKLTVQRGKEDHEVDLTLAPRPWNRR